MRRIILANIFFLLLIFIIFSLCLQQTNFMLELAREDYIVENLTCITYFGSALAFLALLISSWKRHHYSVLTFCNKYKFYFFFLAFTIFVAGEECSWGQRIFNLETGEALKNINLQNEINFHNISIGKFDYSFQYYFIILFFFTVGVFIPLIDLQPTVHKFLRKIKFPVMNLSLIALFIAVVLATKLWANLYNGPEIISAEGKSSLDLFEEYKEMISGIGFLLYPLLIIKAKRNRLRHHTQPSFS